MTKILQIDREAAEKFRLGKGGAYDRRVDLLSGEFASHREQATAGLVEALDSALDALYEHCPGLEHLIDRIEDTLTKANPDA